MDSNQKYHLWLAVIMMLATSAVQSTDLPLGTDYQLTCGSVVNLKISQAKLAEIGYETSQPDEMVLNKGSGSECKATKSGGFFEWQLAGDQVYTCATQYGNEGQTLKFTYTAEIFVTSSGSISRGKLASHTFTCIYKKEQLVSLSTEIHTQIKDLVHAAMDRETGQRAPISLKSTTDATFTTPSTKTTFNVGEKIFISTDMQIQSTADVVVQIAECVAKAPSPNEATEVSLIDQGCSKVPAIVEVLRNYEGISAGFSVKAFFWESLQSGDTTQFTLTCQLKLCANSDTANQCTTRNCNAGRRRKRLIAEKEDNGDVYIANLGPFTVRANANDDAAASEERCNLEQSGCSHACAIDEHNRQICLCPSSEYILSKDGKTCFKIAEAKMETVSIGRSGRDGEMILLLFMFLLGGLLSFVAYLLKRRLGSVNAKETTIVDADDLPAKRAC